MPSDYDIARREMANLPVWLATAKDYEKAVWIEGFVAGLEFQRKAQGGQR